MDYITQEIITAKAVPKNSLVNMEKGLFWDSEREVHITRDKSRLKNIEIVKKSDCEKIMKELSI